MKNEKIYAIVVSFNGGFEIFKTIESIRKQVNKVIVVDNCSDNVDFSALEYLELNANLSLIRLDQNYGIAYAQNIGVAVAHAEGADWVLMLDQDSACAPDMLDKLLAVMESVDKEKIGFICPNVEYQGKNLNADRGSIFTEVASAISSGCLFPMSTLQFAGPQCVEYFIDSVDFEYCLRLRSLGYKLINAGNAVLEHKLGKKTQVSFFGIYFSIFTHSPFRRYYIIRNHIFLIKKFWKIFPLFLIKKTILLIILIMQIFLFESKKGENLHQCWQGLIDGFKGRGGKNVSKLHI
ncbi:glycosyltransferase family 2 protein [Comamonas testosteroni]|jgi:rhamnosyltransferase|uniref:Glycosyl transferase family 2 n=1 Tax=Comamonas testosteroni (strain DSM 14576 / KF-1) TaxID=399795 RepID=B7WT58_COMTK|nr:glycosyltransferase family 2 protein [Comamonas testosteroni]EED65426.1 glycosyl transferase family 2 [Comamonas testosteroni KF-1]WQG68835.1 glycosyltransferase family 2 protein [Comamonas testosteroni]